MRSKSRGTVTLRSADPRDKAVIRFNYMSHPDDWAEMRACVRLTAKSSSSRPSPVPRREISPARIA
jgi:choline dehydrogenase